MSNNNDWRFGRLLMVLVGIATAVIGHRIHGSISWSIIDWLFWPLAWLKWLLCNEVNITIIKESFNFFTK